MLAVRNVEVVYEGVILVLKGVSLEVREGQIVALLGANGAGKTTLLRAITGLLDFHRGELTKGTITLDDAPIHHLDPADTVAAGVAQVMEGRRILAAFTIEENLRIGGQSVDQGSLTAGLDRVYGLFPLLEKRRKQVAGYLSGGEQQMLAIGRALMASPRYLLLDEPSLGLAPLVLQQIRDLIVEINEQGTSVLLIEQNANMALSIAEHGYVMETGKVVMDRPAEALSQDEDVREFYLGLREQGAVSFRDVKHYKRRKRWLS